MKEKPFYNIWKPWIDWNIDHYNIDGCCEASKQGFAYIRYTWEGGRCDKCGALVVEGKTLSFWKRLKLAVTH